MDGKDERALDTDMEPIRTFDAQKSRLNSIHFNLRMLNFNIQLQVIRKKKKRHEIKHINKPF